MFLHSHNVTAGLFLEFAGWAGFMTNAFIVYRVIYAKVFGKTFGTLWISRGVAHCLESLLFVLFFGPIAIVDPYLFDLFLAQQIHHLVYCFRFAVFFSNLVIALNRAVMVLRPLAYKVLFSHQTTLMLIGLTWLISIASGAVNFLDPCQQTAMNSTMNYYAYRNDCNIVLHIYDVGFPPVCFIATAIIDGMALAKLYSLPIVRRELSSNMSLCSTRRAREIRLCYMILCEVITSGLIIVSIRFGFVVALEHEFVGFLLTSWVWGMHSAFDGLIVIFFNTEIHSLRRDGLTRPTSGISLSKQINENGKSSKFALLRNCSPVAMPNCS
uniref:G_PROTEIN_RECEP_F1_2 domain-containing protein n=1 Tax=Steinernema glaseri TaxID=37863 RepID=A0A1I7YK27_9BILA